MSLKGSPGVTTFAVALAAQWPSARRLVAECDPSGGDLALRYGLVLSSGLVSFAAAARRTRDPEMIWDHAQPLLDSTQVLLAPPSGAQARAALHALVTTSDGPLLDQAAHVPGVVVFADCGRMDPGSPAEVIARRADVLILLSGTHGEDLAHLTARMHDLGRWTARPALVLAGQGYSTAEVEHELGIAVTGRIPHDPAVATARSGYAQPSRRRRGGGLARAAAALAQLLTVDATSVPEPRLAPSAGQSAPVALVGQVIPGVPSQQVRLPGVHVSPPQPASPQIVGVPRNGHQPVMPPRRDAPS